MHINPMLKLARECLFHPEKTAMMSMPDGFLVTDCKAMLHMTCPDNPPVPVIAVGVYELASDEITLPAAKTTDRLSYDFTALQLDKCRKDVKIKLSAPKFSKEYKIFMGNSRDDHVSLQFCKNGQFHFKGGDSAWIMDKEKIFSDASADKTVSIDTRYARFLGTVKDRLDSRVTLFLQKDLKYLQVAIKASGEEQAIDIFLPCAQSKEAQEAKPAPKPEPVPKQPTYEATVMKMPDPKDELPHIPSAAAVKIEADLKTEFAVDMRRELKAAVKDLIAITRRIEILDDRLEAFDQKQLKLEEFRKKMNIKLDEARKLTEEI